MFGIGIKTRKGAKQQQQEVIQDIIAMTSKDDPAAAQKASQLVSELENLREASERQRLSMDDFKKDSFKRTQAITDALSDIRSELAKFDSKDQHYETLEKLIEEVQAQCNRVSEESALKSNKSDVHTLSHLKGLASLKPDHFNGSGDATAWIENFEHFSTLMNWTDEEKCTGFPLFLRSQALSWYQSLPKEQKNTWKAVKDSFAVRYEGKGHKWVKARELQNRRLLPGESLDSYTDDIRRLSRDLELPDHIILGAYIEGLPQQIRQIVWQGMPETFNDAEKAAQNAVKMLKLEGANQSISHMETESIAQRIDGSMQRLENLISRLITDKEEKRSEFRNGNERKGNRNTRVICHGCGFSGHIIRDCRLKEVQCHLCAQKGHVRSKCPNQAQAAQPLQ